MTRKKYEILIGVVIMAMSFIFVATETIADEEDVLREIQDRAQINKLMWDYARALVIHGVSRR